MKRKVTIREVANLAGVSISTVSRVVSGSDIVKDSTVERVREAIQKTGYRPNYNAQALAKSATDTVCVVVDRSPTSSLGNTYFVDIIDAIATELDSYEKDLLLAFTGRKEEDEQVRKLAESNKIDGVIKLSVTEHDRSLDYLAQNGIPTVVVGNPRGRNFLFVDNDNERAMYEATSYIIEQGHKRIAFVAGAKEYVVTNDRLQGFQRAMEESKIPYDENDLYFGDFTTESGYIVADKLFVKDYTAVASTDDLLAIGILQKAYEQGREMQAVGFNDSELGLMFQNQLSTVDIHVKELGATAVQLLMNLIEHDGKMDSKIVDTHIIKRW